ncbi:hypothetical protein [Agromyces sp. NPDC055661]
MTRTLRAGALTAAALSLMLALAGCVGPTPIPSPTPDAATPRPTATAAPAPEPVDPLTTVTELVARPDSLELRDAAGGVVLSLGYLSTPSDAVVALTTVFGAAPVDQAVEGGNHFPPRTLHQWDGFELWEHHYVDRWEGVGKELSLERPAFTVRYTGSTARDVSLSTIGGPDVGAGWDELIALPELRQNPSGCSGPYLEYVEESRAAVGGPGTVKISVEFRPSEDSATIAAIDAPVPVYENGCA